MLGGPLEFHNPTSFLDATSPDLKVNDLLAHSFFGIYLPIKKWSDFEIFEPD